MDLIKFTRSCPKCGFDIDYLSLKYSVYTTSNEDYIKSKCTKCGYKWNMETLDKQIYGPHRGI
jgi:C4-type Zn-finger protein